jgi:hypothetical protein
MFDFNSVKVDNDSGQKIYDEILYREEIEKLQKYFPYDKFYIKDHKIVCNGGLIIDSSITLEKLPDNLQLNYLDVRRDSKLKVLPNNLTVNTLTINNDLITKLAHNLTVIGRLEASFSNITELPDDLRVNYLDMQHSSKLKYISENIKYFIYLNISFCNNIKKLPDDLVISDILNISFSSIRKLPNNLHARVLHMKNTKIKELPLDLAVTDAIFIGEDMTNIKNFDIFKDKIKII